MLTDWKRRFTPYILFYQRKENSQTVQYRKVAGGSSKKRFWDQMEENLRAADAGLRRMKRARKSKNRDGGCQI